MNKLEKIYEAAKKNVDRSILYDFDGVPPSHTLEEMKSETSPKKRAENQKFLELFDL